MPDYLVEEYLVDNYLEGDINMSDFNGAKPVKTVRDNEFKIAIVDFASGEVATNGWNIDGDGAGLIRGVDLDIRDLTFATDAVNVTGSSVSITGDVNVTATDLDIRDLAFATDKVDVTGSSVTVEPGTNPIVVSATDLDIRDLSHVSDSIKVGDGTDFLAINTDGSINIITPEIAVGDYVLDYKTTATVGAGSTSNHDYVIASGEVFKGDTVLVGARGAVKVEFGLWDGLAFTSKGVYFQDPKENREYNISKLAATGDGTLAVRIIITNLDGASSDVYSTLQGTSV